MTDNFKRYEEYMRSFGIIPEKKDESGKYYFSVAIIRRGTTINTLLPQIRQMLQALHVKTQAKNPKSVQSSTLAR